LLAGLAVAALVLLAVTMVPSGPAIAQMAGGAGGNGNNSAGAAGAGGPGGTTASPDGSDGYPANNGNAYSNGGGGGGGGSVSLTTGAGGSGGAGGVALNAGSGTAGTAGNVGSTTATNNTGTLTGGVGGGGGPGASSLEAQAGGGGGGGGGFGLLLTTSGSNSSTGIITGGAGGNGGSSGLNMAAGPNPATSTGGGGGGGAGGGGLLLTGPGSYTNSGALQGGAGGTGAFSQVGSGGGGGDGGVGAALTGGGGVINVTGASISGGTGGAAGGGGFDAVHVGLSGASGGNGGAGGAGILAINGGTITNAGTISGANGGLAGVSDLSNGAAGAGGAGIIGSGLVISNSNAITGGMSGDGVTQNYAIVFTGGANSLGSTGTISGGINVQGGAFAPALSTSAIGTPLSFGGPITFASGTQYVVRVSPSAADNLTASGVGTLTGATVNAQFSSGSYLSKQYTILTATGGLGGTTFSGLTNTSLPSGFTDSLSYDTTNGIVFLDLTATLGAVGTVGTTGLNQNQGNVANGLNNFFNGGGSLPPNFITVFGLTGSSLANALTALDGEAATDAEKGAFTLMNQFLGLMLDPFVDGRFGTSGGPIGFAPDQQASFPPDIALAYASVLKAPPPSFDQRWTAWGSAFGASSTTNGNAAIGSNNVTATDYGFAAGMDYHVTPSSLYGFALAGAGTNWNLAQGLGTGRSDAFQAGVYGKSYWGSAYVAAALAFTNNWFSTARTALGDDLTARFAGQSYGGRLETGYRYGLPMGGSVVGATPYAAIQTQWFHTPTYNETDLSGGGLGLTYNAMTANDTRSELGARFDDPTLLNGMPLILRARFAWAHDWVSNPSLDAVFQSLPGSSFVVNGATPPKDSALASAGAQYFFSPAWSFTTKFDAEFAASSQTYGGSGTLRYTW